MTSYLVCGQANLHHSDIVQGDFVRYVNDCQMTDKGVKDVLTNLENVESLEVLDISGNLIG